MPPYQPHVWSDVRWSLYLWSRPEPPLPAAYREFPIARREIGRVENPRDFCKHTVEFGKVNEDAIGRLRPNL